MHTARYIAVLLIALPGLAYSYSGTSPVALPGGSAVNASGSQGISSSINAESSGDAYLDVTATFGGYIANSSALRAVAANGAGQYAVAGTSVTNIQYFAIYDSATNIQICETTFLATHDGADPYDTGFATG